MSAAVLFALIYFVFPGFILFGFWLGCRWQLKQDAEQSLLPKPYEEWRIAVFKAQMKAEVPSETP